MGKKWKQWQIFIFLGSKITSDSDYSYRINICLLLGRKAMTNLDSILKTRVTVLPTKVYIAKAMFFFFPTSYVWMWELNNKEGSGPKNRCFQSVVLEKTLESPLDSKKIKPVNLKGNQPWIFIGRTDAEAETPILWPPDMKSWLTGKDPDAGKDRGQGEKWVTEDEVVGWHHQVNGHEFEQILGESEGQGSLASCSPWGCKESDMT